MLRHKGLLGFVIAANAVGALYGFVFYYGEALKSVNPVLAVFVPDCPLYALLFAVALALMCLGRRLNLFYFLVFIGALKYGFWTMFVLVKYSDYYFTQNSLLYSILFVSHLGLFLETVLLLGKITLKKSHLPIALVWFLMNDLADYVLKTHPPLPEEALQYMFIATVLMSLFFCGLSFFLVKRIKRPISSLRLF